MMSQVASVARCSRTVALVLGLMILVPRIAAAQCSSTATLACGETKSGALSALGEIDCFTFDAVAGETVNVTTSVTAGVFQACWEIKAPGGASLTKFCGG